MKYKLRISFHKFFTKQTDDRVRHLVSFSRILVRLSFNRIWFWFCNRSKDCREYREGGICVVSYSMVS